MVYCLTTVYDAGQAVNYCCTNVCCTCSWYTLYTQPYLGMIFTAPDVVATVVVANVTSAAFSPFLLLVCSMCATIQRSVTSKVVTRWAADDSSSQCVQILLYLCIDVQVLPFLAAVFIYVYLAIDNHFASTIIISLTLT